jgi:hypothetical protein
MLAVTEMFTALVMFLQRCVLRMLRRMPGILTEKPSRRCSKSHKKETSDL